MKITFIDNNGTHIKLVNLPSNPYSIGDKIDIWIRGLETDDPTVTRETHTPYKIVDVRHLLTVTNHKNSRSSIVHRFDETIQTDIIITLIPL